VNNDWSIVDEMTIRYSPLPIRAAKVRLFAKVPFPFYP